MCLPRVLYFVHIISLNICFMSSADPVNVHIDGIIDYGKKWSYQYKVEIPEETTTEYNDKHLPRAQEDAPQTPEQTTLDPQRETPKQVKKLQVQKRSQLIDEPWMHGMSLRQQRLQFYNPLQKQSQMRESETVQAIAQMQQPDAIAQRQQPTSMHIIQPGALQAISQMQQPAVQAISQMQQPAVQAIPYMPQPGALQAIAQLQQPVPMETISRLQLISQMHEQLLLKERLQKQKLIQMQEEAQLAQQFLTQKKAQLQQLEQDRLLKEQQALMHQRLQQIKDKLINQEPPYIKTQVHLQEPSPIQENIQNQAPLPQQLSQIQPGAVRQDQLLPQSTTQRETVKEEVYTAKEKTLTPHSKKVTTVKHKSHHHKIRLTAALDSGTTKRKRKRHKTETTASYKRHHHDVVKYTDYGADYDYPEHHNHHKNNRHKDKSREYEMAKHHKQKRHQSHHTSSKEEYKRQSKNQHKKSKEITDTKVVTTKPATIERAFKELTLTNVTNKVINIAPLSIAVTTTTEKQAPKIATEILTNLTFHDIIGNPQRIRSNAQINTFTTHILSSGLKVFETLKDKTSDYGLKLRIDSIATNYEGKYKEFLADLAKYKIKTRLGTQKVILNAIDESDRILKRLLNDVVADMDQRGNLRENLDTANTFQYEVEKETKLELIHICKKFGICRTGNGFSEFLINIFSILLRVDDVKFQQAVDSLTEVTKNMDFGQIFNSKVQHQIKHTVHQLEMEHLNTLRPKFMIIKNIIANKNKPLIINKFEAKNSRLNSTIALLEVVDIFEEKLPRTDAHIIDWGDLRTSMNQWADNKRSDIQDIMATFMEHIRTALDSMSPVDQERIEANFEHIING